jgi:uncharacterized protein (TIGR02301 family)
MILCRSATVLVFACASSALPAFAQPAANPAPQAKAPAAEETERPTPYDEDLTRLSVILGSVQYLRNLCNTSKEDDWRLGMQQLLDTETKGEPKRREKLTAAFNRGYRSFASVYTDCTSQAIVAEERYRNEGATLATEITARFGN